MRRVSMGEARRRLGELVDAVSQGESVTITRGGRDVARLTSIRPEEGCRLPSLAAFRESIKADGEPLSETVVRLRRQQRF